VKAIGSLSPSGFKLIFHNYTSSIPLRLGQLCFHPMFLTDNFSLVDLTDSNNLLAEKSEYVGVSDALMRLRFKLSYLCLDI
jgi:hypothetical protein